MHLRGCRPRRQHEKPTRSSTSRARHCAHLFTPGIVIMNEKVYRRARACERVRWGALTRLRAGGQQAGRRNLARRALAAVCVQKIDPVTQSVCQLFHGPRPALTPPTALDPAPPLPFNHKYRVLAPGGYMYSTVLNQSLATIEKFDDPPNINQRDQVYIRIRPAPATPFSVSGLRGARWGQAFRARN